MNLAAGSHQDSRQDAGVTFYLMNLAAGSHQDSRQDAGVTFYFELPNSFLEINRFKSKSHNYSDSCLII